MKPMRYKTKRDLPQVDILCEHAFECVYGDSRGYCDDPRINHGNGDAYCFGVRPRVVLSWLGIRKETDENADAETMS